MKFCVTLFALLALSCAPVAEQAAATPNPAKAAEEEEEWQAPLEKVGASEVYPTADGGAYVMTPNGRLWYVKEQRAYRVAESKSPISRAAVLNPGFAQLSVERQRARESARELKLAKFQIEELQGAQ